MKQSKEKTAGSYPQWREYIQESRGDSFTRIFVKLDAMLKSKFDHYVSGSLYNQLLITMAEKLERKGKPINVICAVKAALSQSLTQTCGVYNMSPKSIAADPELSRIINELQTVLIDTALMVQTLDGFDELNELPINAN